MFYQLQIYLSCLFLFCNNAQEHLTCLRTNDIVNSANPSPCSSNIQRGYRDKQGPKGEKGDTGISVNAVLLLVLRGMIFCIDFCIIEHV